MIKHILVIAALALMPFSVGATSPKVGEAAVKAGAAPKNGEVAPDFSLTGADGKTYKLSDYYKDKIVVLEWTNKDCPYVKKFYDSNAMQKLQADAKAKGVVWFSIISSAPGKEGHMNAKDVTEYRTQKSVNNTATLLDSQATAAKAYFAKTTPHMFVINKGGTLAYQGAIDDKPSADPKELKGATNYVEAAITALTAKDPKAQTIKVSSKDPYGCSVKY